jgi:hypothetical protein
MSELEKDPWAGAAGSRTVDKHGKVTAVEAPTRDHPDGNRPRNEKGEPLDLVPQEPAPAVPAASKDLPPAKGEKKGVQQA